ncbi:MAG: arylsulfatase [Planctomycetaceae bacterium]|nr:arylsulfatase [Planctomycetaceae bacterium]
MTRHPHVLLITADHWPGSLLGAAGHPVIQTPTLDQLARSGTRFANAYSECPVCIPARRTLLTGTCPRTHGDRTFQPELTMPDVPTLAEAFNDAGYQTYAVGKLHVYPPRARVGFDDVILSEEGRPQYGPTDDYEIYLGEQGLVGQQFLHGMSNNDYVSRPWHLAEEHHVTNWTSREMARMIQRRDPIRPGFWFLSYTHPHPPMVPPQCYLDIYRDVDPGHPSQGTWRSQPDEMPARMNNRLIDSERYDAKFIRQARRAFYALCTHIDHQIRVVIGTLREEGLLDNTVILFTADHGDMLGDHGLWSKRMFYDSSACVPMIVVGASGSEQVPCRTTNDRLVSWQDIMPTLLDLAGVAIPETVDGESMFSDQTREALYGEYGEGAEATRMIRDSRHKLIYYAYGNRLQLFDLKEDPQELDDLSRSADHANVKARLTELLVSQMYGSDSDLLRDGELVGVPVDTERSAPDRTLSLQRGRHWPVPPQS